MKNTNWGYIVIVLVLTVIAATSIGVTEYLTNNEIAHLSVNKPLMIFNTPNQNGIVAGVSIDSSMFIIRLPEDNDITIEFNIEDYMTLSSVMKRVNELFNVVFNFEENEGKTIVSSINGIKNNNNLKWSFYLDDELFEKDIDEISLLAGQIYEFKFE